MVGYLFPQSPMIAEVNLGYRDGRLDSYVGKVLAEEPVDVQLSVTGILSILKSVAGSMAKESRQR